MQLCQGSLRRWRLSQVLDDKKVGERGPVERAASAKAQGGSMLSLVRPESCDQDGREMHNLIRDRLSL